MSILIAGRWVGAVTLADRWNWHFKRAEPVADASLYQNVLGLNAVGLELTTQTRNEGVQVGYTVVILKAPHTFQNLAKGANATGVGHQVAEHAKLLRCQLHRFPLHQHF